MLAVRQLADEAGIYLSVTKFGVINTVGAVNLHTQIACDAFANAHSSEVHYDRSSFVAMAWRPPSMPICVELYATGRANVPGAKSERELVSSFATLLPELMKFRAELHADVADSDSDCENECTESCSDDASNSGGVALYNESFWSRLKGMDIDVDELKTLTYTPADL